MIKTNIFGAGLCAFGLVGIKWLRGAGKEGGSGRSSHAYQLCNCPWRLAGVELREG